MSMRRRGLFAGIVAAGVACAGLGFYALYGASISGDLIDPGEVSLLNMESFKEQLRRDLPPGTTKEDAEAYLNRREIAHSFVGPDVALPSAGNVFRALIEDVGPPFIYLYLEIRIWLDEQDKVREVAFRLTY